jgi:hypothetical protein
MYFLILFIFSSNHHLIWQKPLFIIGSVIMGSLMGALAISSINRPQTISSLAILTAL